MNTIEQMITLSEKLKIVLKKKNGFVTLTFYNGRIITGGVLSSSIKYNFLDNSYTSTITIFESDINDTTQYDFGTVQDIK